MNVDNALLFLDFVAERHKIWESRQTGQPQPWTDDPILATRKFTNAFRLLDPGSQFVITDLMEEDLPPEEFVMRCFLYRHTGRIEAWEYLPLALGRYPLQEDLQDVLEAWKEYRGPGVTKLKKVKPAAERPNKAGGFQETVYPRKIFTGAYLVFPQSQVPGTDKLESIVGLAQRLVKEGAFTRFAKATTQRQRFMALRENKGVADFMSMQTLTDFGYSTEFREDDFVVPGPGARKGAAALGLTGEQAIEWAFENTQDLDPLPMIWGKGNRGHFLSKMDLQNCLCEFGKYVRYAGRPSPEKLYAPAHPGVQLKPVLPPKWHTKI